jgi:hypothetical protein
MTDQTALDYTDVEKRYLPDLYRFIVPIAHEGDDGTECIGSGVLVNLSGRHFIATAKHCIQHDPRVIHSGFIMVENQAGTQARLATDRPIRILKRGWHPTLDVGFLEVGEAIVPEMREDQLCFAKLTAGSVFVVGHPVCKIERCRERREFILNRCSFGTRVLEATDDCWKLEYPIAGLRAANGEWLQGEAFPDAKGFSGGGCFGISKTVRAGLEVIEYSLSGIQSSWHKGERWVKVIPIKQWFDGVKQAL